MAAYLIAQVKLKDDSFVPEYSAKVHGIVAKHGGKYLSRSANISVLEGDPNADVIAVVAFPSVAAAQAFADDPDYAPFAAARQEGADNMLCIIDDTDATGGIPYLAAG